MPYVEVAVLCPLPSTYDYHTERPLSRGQAVLVPLGHRKIWGIVWSVRDTTPDYACKSILSVGLFDPLPESVLQAAAFAARYYHYPLGATLAVLVPSALLRLKKSPAGVFYDGKLVPETFALTTAQYALLQRGRLPHRLCTPSQKRMLGRLLKTGVWQSRTASPPHRPVTEQPVVPCHAEQASIAERLSACEGFSVEVLYGITGSGKTRVYLAVMAAVLARGGQVLCLVPEIHLVPQWLEAIQAFLPGYYVVTLHSAVSEAERAAAWHAVQRGFADIVLGTRLSVFAPLIAPALIIVDEEHDPSYKQQDTLRYHARDMAIWRAQHCQIPILLGSATPSLETVHHCLEGQYRCHPLLSRAIPEARLPQIHLVPGRYFLCQRMQSVLADHLAQSEQVMIFLNRRGYVPTVRCTACHWIAQCAHCSVRLVAHKQHHRLMCHHCGSTQRYPEVCPACSQSTLLCQGYGTERIEEDVQALWPQARLLRIDRDTTTRRGDFERMRTQISDESVDIIIGTQILAKGHNFQRLHCVAVAAIDDVLMGADFRREERLFALMMQVMGRVGRFGQESHVYIQTAHGEHRFFDYLLKQDYWAFACALLAERRTFTLPPYVFYAAILTEAPSEEVGLQFLESLRLLVVAWDDPQVRCYYPVSLVIAKKMDRYRAQLIIESSVRSARHRTVHQLMAYAEKMAPRDVRCRVDMDPMEV